MAIHQLSYCIVFLSDVQAGIAAMANLTIVHHFRVEEITGRMFPHVYPRRAIGIYRAHIIYFGLCLLCLLTLYFLCAGHKSVVFVRYIKCIHSVNRVNIVLKRLHLHIDPYGFALGPPGYIYWDNSFKVSHRRPKLGCSWVLTELVYIGLAIPHNNICKGQ